jgi:hypothetical protein
MQNYYFSSEARLLRLATVLGDHDRGAAEKRIVHQKSRADLLLSERKDSQ